MQQSIPARGEPEEMEVFRPGMSLFVCLVVGIFVWVCDVQLSFFFFKAQRKHIGGHVYVSDISNAYLLHKKEFFFKNKVKAAILDHTKSHPTQSPKRCEHWMLRNLVHGEPRRCLGPEASCARLI